MIVSLLKDLFPLICFGENKGFFTFISQPKQISDILKFDNFIIACQKWVEIDDVRNLRSTSKLRLILL